FRQVATLNIAVEVESLPVPIGIFEHDVTILIVDIGRRFETLCLNAPAQFRSRYQGIKQLLSGSRVNSRGIDFLCGLYLWTRKTFRTIRAFAQQHFGIEVAFGGVVNETILQPIPVIAGVKSGLVNDRVLARSDVAGRILQYGVCNP